jgi:hypothetical protein
MLCACRMHVSALSALGLSLFVLAGCQKASTSPTPNAERADETNTFCPFADSLSESEDLGLIELTFDETLTKDSLLTPLQEAQILAFFNRHSNPQSAHIAIENLTDDHEIRVFTAVSSNSDLDPFTVYKFHAGDNPMGFIYLMDSMQFVAEIGDGQIICGEPEPQSDGCEIDGILKVAGDWPTFSTWNIEFSRDRLIHSSTDQSFPGEWNTVHTKEQFGTLHTLIQVTDFPEGIVSTMLNLRVSNCHIELGPDVEIVSGTTTTIAPGGATIEEHTLHFE